MPDRRSSRGRLRRRRESVLHRRAAQERRRASRAAERHAQRQAPAADRARDAARAIAAIRRHERRVVTQAAVIGRTFGLDLLAAIVGRWNPCAVAARRYAAPATFNSSKKLTPRVFRFRHGLTRDAIYGDFLGAEVQPLPPQRSRWCSKTARTDEPLDRSTGLSLVGCRRSRSCCSLQRNGRRCRGPRSRARRCDRILRAGARVRDVDPLVRGSIMERSPNCALALSWAEGGPGDIFRRRRTSSAKRGHYEHEATCHCHRRASSRTGLGMPESDRTARSDAAQASMRASIWRAAACISVLRGWRRRSASRRARRIISSRLIRVRSTRRPISALRFHNVAAWVAMTIGDIGRFRREQAAWIPPPRLAVRCARCCRRSYKRRDVLVVFRFARRGLEHIQRALQIAPGTP